MAHVVTGRVVRFNVYKDFTHYDGKDNYINVHHSCIAKNNPHNLIRCLAQNEIVQFNEVMSIKNIPQAANVTGTTQD